MNRIQYSIVLILLLFVREMGRNVIRNILLLLETTTTATTTSSSSNDEESSIIVRNIIRTPVIIIFGGDGSSSSAISTQQQSSWLLYCIEIIRCLLIILPFCCIISYLHKRFTVRYIPSFIISSTTSLYYYCGISYILFADIILDQWIQSLSCYPTSLVTTTSNIPYISQLFKILFTKQYYGLNCPSSSLTSQEEEITDRLLYRRIIVSTLSKNNTIVILFLLRFVSIVIGIYIGSSIVFIALTGSIATGKSTVGKFLLQLNTDNNNNKQKQQQQQSAVVSIIDSDRIGHDILLPPNILEQRQQNSKEDQEEEQSLLVSPKDSVYNTIIQVFGDPAINNTNILSDDSDTKTMIDRIKLGAIVFQNPSLRRKLNSITHPKILLILLQQMLYQSLFGRSKLVIVDIPLLYETKRMIPLFGIIIMVSCEIHADGATEIQYQRIQQRNPELKSQQIYDRIASQLSLQNKVVASDIIVWNTSTTTLQQLQHHVQTTIYPQLVARYYGFCSIHHYVIVVGLYYFVLILIHAYK